MSATERHSRKQIQPGRCTVCSSSDRVSIELARCGGASLDSVARQFKVSRWAIMRHFNGHVSNERKSELLAGDAIANLAEMAAKEDRSLLSYYQMVRGVLAKQFLTCAEVSDRTGTALLAGKLHENFAAIGRLTGELNQLSMTLNQHNTTTINFVGSPAFTQLVEGVLSALRDFPEARMAVARAIRDLSDATPPPNGSRFAAVPALIEGELAHAE
jgi:hypothetical protein